ncbi:MAG: SdrD B-like domain-containing protein, partial [Bacillota bacterium]|nr:SdrD B-like domain-containing protein [Bacillota bacterium]
GTPEIAQTPGNVKEGGALTTDGTYIYAFQGNKDGGRGFWRYNVATNTWTTMALAPATVKWGGALTYVNGYIYAFRGDAKKDFWRYDIAADTWTAMASAPQNVKEGGALTTDGTNVFALRGDGKKDFWRYNVATNTWSTLLQTSENVKHGGSLAYVHGTLLQSRNTSMTASPTLVSGGDTITVTMRIESSQPVNNVTPGPVTITGTGGASATLVTGSVLVSADNDLTGEGDSVIYRWTYTAIAGASPGSLTFRTSATGVDAGSATVSFPLATTNSVLVSPFLTYQVTVGSGALSPILNTALLIENSLFAQGIQSNEVQTTLGVSIGDYIWLDANSDGVQDATEEGIPGVTVLLKNVEGNVIMETVTDEEGYYLFTGVPAGTYTVEVVPPTGMVQTYGPGPEMDSSYTFTVTAGEEYLTVDFGYNYTGCITGTVFRDHNGNKLFDPDEEVLAGIQVYLYLDTDGNGIITDSDIRIAETQTDMDGSYSFGSLPPGDYLVFVDEMDPALPDGYQSTTGNLLAVTLELETMDECVTNVNFGFTAFGVIGDLVWLDSNRNGVFDTGEGGIPGVTVILRDGLTNEIIAVTVTSSDGSYFFRDLPPGTYTVEVDATTLPPGVAPTYPSAAPYTHTATLAFDEEGLYIVDDLDADFGFAGVGTIGDYVWRDENGNGQQDDGSTGIPGVTVYLYQDFNQNGQYDPGEILLTTTTTDASGYYLFEGLPPGNYVVYVNPNDGGIPAYYTYTTASSVGVVLGPGGVYLQADFGFGPFVQIGDTVFYDTDRDGTQDLGETGIPGVTVVLKDSGGNVIATTTTDENGEYRFIALPTGTYTVEVITPAGLTPSTLTAYTVVANVGGYYLDNDFGFYGSGTIGDFVWKDTNGDGIQDEGEFGFEGITVMLILDENRNGIDDDGEPVVAVMVTDEDGYYLFENLPAGQYLVLVYETPEGWASTTPRMLVVDLAPGDDYDKADFGLTEGNFSSIGDTVFYDANRNGIQDTGTTQEMGLEGIEVILYQKINGVWVEAGRQTTDEFGYYLFNGLAAGEYKVALNPDTVPPGWDYIPPNVLNGYDVNENVYYVNLTTPQYFHKADFGLVGDRADIGITKVYQGTDDTGLASFLITVTNGGPQGAANVMVVDTLPPEMSFVSLDPTPTDFEMIGDENGSTTLTWNAGTLAAGGSQSYVLTVQLTPCEGICENLVNAIRVSADPYDPNMDNNEDTAVVPPYIPAAPSFNLYKEVWDGLVWVDADEAPGVQVDGTVATFRIRVVNTGNVALNISFADVLTAVGGKSREISVEGVTNLEPGDEAIRELADVLIFTGQNRNTVTATAVYEGITLQATAVAHVFGAAPSVTVQKDVSFDNGLTWYSADTAPGPEYDPATMSDPVFRFVVTNTGNVPLTNIEITDEINGEITPIGEPPFSLAQGEFKVVYHYPEYRPEQLQATDVPDWIMNQNVEVSSTGDGWQFVPFKNDPHTEGSWVVRGDRWATGYWYYSGIIEPGEAVTLPIDVYLNEALTPNEYQGATFYLQPSFESVQVSNEAVFDVWGMGYVTMSPNYAQWLEVSYNTDNSRWEAEDSSQSFFWNMMDKLWELVQ